MTALDFFQGAAAIGLLAFGIPVLNKRSEHETGTKRLAFPLLGLNLSLAIFLICAGLRQGSSDLASLMRIVSFVLAGILLARSVRPILSSVQTPEDR